MFVNCRSDCCICREVFDMATMVALPEPVSDAPVLNPFQKTGPTFCFRLACRPCAETVGGALLGGASFGAIIDSMSRNLGR